MSDAEIIEREKIEERYKNVISMWNAAKHLKTVNEAEAYVLLMHANSVAIECLKRLLPFQKPGKKRQFIVREIEILEKNLRSRMN
jgi:hypothetical protein